MPLIFCPECKCEISDKAEICVHCGCPISKQKRRKSVGNIFQNLKTNIVKYNKILIAVLAVCIIFIILHCCFNRKLNADQIRYKGEILTLNSNVDDIADVFLNAYVIDSLMFNEDFLIHINDDNLVASILIKTSEVKTYKGISVGDEVSKIESSFQYVDVNDSDNYYIVYLDNQNNEISISVSKPDSYKCITYFIEDNCIKSIFLSETNN